VLISEVLLDAMARHADRLALVSEQGSLTYNQLYLYAKGNLAEMDSAGIRPGMPVVLTCGNSIEFLVGFVALELLGAVPAMLNPGYTVWDIRQAAETVGARHVLAAKAEPGLLAAQLPDLQFCQVRLTPQTQLVLPRLDVTESAVGLIRFSSGTTGAPKAVAYSHANWTWGILDRSYSGDPEAAYLCPISCSIRLGRCFRSWGVGATIFALDSFTAQKTAAWSAYRSFRRIWASPVMLKQLVDEVPDHAVFSQVAGFSSVGSYLPPALQQSFQDKFGVMVYQYYGQKESINLVEMPDNKTPVVGSVGKAVPGSEIRIVEPDADGVGEIQYRSVRAAIGFMEEGQFVPRTALPGGWFPTGDSGRLDAAGYLYVMGRTSRFISVGGLKATPGEIENVLYQFPGVVAVKVSKQPNFLLGEVPVAQLVVPGRGREVIREIKAFCRERLSRHKVPVKIMLVEEIPVNAAGKME
jgi:acyl-CoA synthetase (AMP-forming)/AMP-acid ligase II